MASRTGWTVTGLSLLLAGCLGLSQLPLSTEPVGIDPLPSANPAVETLAPPTSTPSAIPTITSTPEPFGCKQPPDEYTRLSVNGWNLNQRTLSMLAQAQLLYNGGIELTGYAITQGSYTNEESASFGTHAGGGAVDLSVLKRGTYEVLWDDIPSLLYALRAAGFAAWLREYGELYEGSPIHIHAIAIGDADLSPAAQDQLTGEAGYFRGFTGLPVALYGPPTPDKYGGPILCQWMIDLGYRDLR